MMHDSSTGNLNLNTNNYIIEEEEEGASPEVMQKIKSKKYSRYKTMAQSTMTKYLKQQKGNDSRQSRAVNISPELSAAHCVEAAATENLLTLSLD